MEQIKKRMTEVCPPSPEQLRQEREEQERSLKELRRKISPDPIR